MIHNFSGKVITEKAVRQLMEAHGKASKEYLITGIYKVPVLTIMSMRSGRPDGPIKVRITQSGCVYPHTPL